MEHEEAIINLVNEFQQFLEGEAGFVHAGHAHIEALASFIVTVIEGRYSIRIAYANGVERQASGETLEDAVEKFI